jgi:hypothetical protein
MRLVCRVFGHRLDVLSVEVDTDAHVARYIVTCARCGFVAGAWPVEGA